MVPDNFFPPDASGPFRMSVAPETLKQALLRKAVDFAVLLVRPHEAPTSGVLVKVDECYGILTAEHVIYEPDPPFDNREDSPQTLILPFRAYPEPSLGNKMFEDKIFPDALRIPMNRLSWFPEARKRGKYGRDGPDLAFIRLPTSCISEIQAKKVFYGLTLSGDRLREASTDDGILAVVGSPAEWFNPGPHAHGQELFRLATIVTIFSELESRDVHDEWDFLNVILYPATAVNEGRPLPSSFEGVSGGPVFRFPGTKKMPFEEWTKVEPVLAGIVFWQEWQNPETRLLRAHGPQSIYDTFVHQVRSWLLG